MAITGWRVEFFGKPKHKGTNIEPQCELYR
jgi:hypothetical protein